MIKVSFEARCHLSSAVDRKSAVRVHITQDDFGYWMMSFECADGTLVLLSYRAERVDHEIQQAYHPEKIGFLADVEFRISEPSIPLLTGDPNWTKPEPRRAREPWYVVRNGKREA
jgi:hypothetical protein